MNMKSDMPVSRNVTHLLFFVFLSSFLLLRRRSSALALDATRGTTAEWRVGGKVDVLL
jgi:hypothetical protein